MDKAIKQAYQKIANTEYYDDKEYILLVLENLYVKGQVDMLKELNEK